MIESKALAFKHEFYVSAKDTQVRDDLISYLGEYRFQVPEFKYKLGLIDGKLVDPNTGESMLHKAKKAVESKLSEGLNISREEADFAGIVNLEMQLKINPFGTIVWFSPPGAPEEGYGDYGFAYVGEKIGNSLDMTAIRLEKPKMSDFNKASGALWGQIGYRKAEDFISDPKVVNINKEKVVDFIHGVFKIGDKEETNVFKECLKNLNGVISDYIEIVKNGTDNQKEKALHAVENFAIELKNNFPQFAKFKLSELMEINKYVAEPPKVTGSCGSTSQSNNLSSFGSKLFENVSKKSWDFDQPGPCRMCGSDVPCGPCKICKSCNDEIDREEKLAA